MRHLKNLYNRIIKKKNGWNGKYSNWEDALKYSDGYDKQLILEKCKESILKVKNGDAVYERDSVIFSKIEHNWPVLSIMQKIAVEKHNKLKVLDFGGSFGSLYYSSKAFLKNLFQLSWAIVEQEHFVKEGRVHFEDENLKFFYTVEDAIENNEPDLIILSSVLQYIENPKVIIDKVCSLNCEYIIIDRTPVKEKYPSYLTIQTVPPHIYNASYPCWIFQEESLIKLFKNYNIQFKFNTYVTPPSIVNGDYVEWVGFILKRNIS